MHPRCACSFLSRGHLLFFKKKTKMKEKKTKMKKKKKTKRRLKSVENDYKKERGLIDFN